MGYRSRLLTLSCSGLLFIVIFAQTNSNFAEDSQSLVPSTTFTSIPASTSSLAAQTHTVDVGNAVSLHYDSPAIGIAEA